MHAFRFVTGGGGEMEKNIGVKKKKPFPRKDYLHIKCLKLSH